MKDPKIFNPEVKLAQTKLINNNAIGPDRIVIKIDDFVIDKITEIINNIYDNDDILEDVRQYIFIALSKKPGSNEC